MIIEEHDGQDERTVLRGLITDSAVLARIAPKWKQGGLFAGQWANMIAGWGVAHFNKYNQPPGKSIKGYFTAWAAKGRRDENIVGMIEGFLSDLSDEREAAPEYILDVASRLFNSVAFRKHAEAIQGAVDSGDLELAEKLVATHGKVELSGGDGIDPFNDPAAINAMFEEKQEPLIIYPGDAGRFFGDCFSRDCFIAFLGPEKRGKSFWLLDVAYRAMLQRRRVAYFEVGDMSQSQVVRRLAARLMRRPLAFDRNANTATARLPRDITVDDDGHVEVAADHKEWAEEVTPAAAWEAAKRLIKQKIKSDESYFRLSTHPNSTIGVAGIRGMLTGWERQGWGPPDVIVIDYADILAPPAGTADSRDQINASWKQMRALSQQLHCLVVTATQADAASYNAALITRSNFSEDKRKLGHVTSQFGLNQTEEEKASGVMRLNSLGERNAAYDSRACLYVAGEMKIANPAMVSYFK